MNIHEYQAKELLRAAGVPVQPGEVAATPSEAEALARRVGGPVVIKAQVPFAEMLTYANDLISKTQGRASYSMEFSHYDYVPNELAEKVIAAHKAAHGEQLVEEEA